jgi:hypothetical protein
VDSLRMTKKDLAKNYQTESITLDYLRPRDFEDDKIKTGNNYFRGKGQPKNYVIKKPNKKEDDNIGGKSKSERAALAIMRIMRAQEQKRKKDE